MYRKRLANFKKNNALQSQVQIHIVQKEPELDALQQLQIQEYEDEGMAPPPEVFKPKRRKYLPGERLLISINKDRVKNKVKKTTTRQPAMDTKALSKGISRMVNSLTI